LDLKAPAKHSISCRFDIAARKTSSELLLFGSKAVFYWVVHVVQEERARRCFCLSGQRQRDSQKKKKTPCNHGERASG
jgi:hypothetical protein